MFFFFSSRRRHTRYWRDWSSDVCSSDLGPRDEDGALEGVLDGLVAEAPGDGGEHLPLALYGLGAGVHEGEGARAVGVLGQPPLKSHLAEERSLLVPRDARDRDLGPEDLPVGVPVDIRAGPDLGERLARDAAEHLEELVVPPEVEDVVHERARGVRVVGDVLASACELVDEPGVDGAQSDLAVLRPLFEALDVVKDRKSAV